MCPIYIRSRPNYVLLYMEALTESSRVNKSRDAQPEGSTQQLIRMDDGQLSTRKDYFASNMRPECDTSVIIVVTRVLSVGYTSRHSCFLILFLYEKKKKSK